MTAEEAIAGVREFRKGRRATQAEIAEWEAEGRD
jgi:hypothetical protein